MKAMWSSPKSPASACGCRCEPLGLWGPKRKARELMKKEKTMRLCFIVLVFGTSLSAYGAAEGGTERPPRWLPVDDEGWTILRPARDTRLIYVSSSAGDDSAARFYSPGDPAVGSDPFRPKGPVKPYRTVRSGLAAARDGHPDWVLLKRGDVWYESLGSPPNGRSAQEPSVIGAYGDAPRRPQLRLRGTQSGLQFHIHDGFHDVAIVELEFYAVGKDPESPEFDPECAVKSAIGVFISAKHMTTGRRLLVEDCCMRFCGASFQVAWDRRVGPTPATEQLVLRRNLVLDNYSRNSHCQGTYAAGVSILLEENIYDHNGWLVQEQGNRKDRGGATIFNHNTYFCDCRDVVFRNNMFLRASSIGNKWTANSGPASARNLVMDNNLYVEGELGISAGGNTPGPLRFQNVAITNNVFLDLGRGRPTLRNLGWGIDVTDWDGGRIAGNVLVQRNIADVQNVHLLSVKASDESGACRNVAVTDNVFCGAAVYFLQNSDRLEDITFSRNTLLMPWLERPLICAAGTLAGCTFSKNTYSSERPAEHWFLLNGQGTTFDEWTRRTGEQGSAAKAVQPPDPVRTIESYMAHQGLEPTLDAFIEEIRKQSRANWRNQFTASAVNDWVRQGFGLGAID